MQATASLAICFVKHSPAHSTLSIKDPKQHSTCTYSYMYMYFEVLQSSYGRPYRGHPGVVLAGTRTSTKAVTTETSSERLESNTGLRTSQPVDSVEPILVRGRSNPLERCGSFLHTDSSLFQAVIRGLLRRVDSFLV